MRTVDKLHRKVKRNLPLLADLKYEAKIAEIQAVCARIPIPELKEIALSDEPGFEISRERFNEIWTAAGGKSIPAEEWGGKY